LLMGVWMSPQVERRTQGKKKGLLIQSALARSLETSRWESRGWRRKGEGVEPKLPVAGQGDGGRVKGVRSRGRG